VSSCTRRESSKSGKEEEEEKGGKRRKESFSSSFFIVEYYMPLCRPIPTAVASKEKRSTIEVVLGAAKEGRSPRSPRQLPSSVQEQTADTVAALISTPTFAKSPKVAPATTPSSAEQQDKNSPPAVPSSSASTSDSSPTSSAATPVASSASTSTTVTSFGSIDVDLLEFAVKGEHIIREQQQQKREVEWSFVASNELITLQKRKLRGSITKTGSLTSNKTKASQYRIVLNAESKHQLAIADNKIEINEDWTVIQAAVAEFRRRRRRRTESGISLRVAVHYYF